MPDNERLDELIIRVAENDSAAFEQLYRETHSSVYAFALSILKNSHNAEDVLHDAYLCIHTSAPRYKSTGKPMAWIMTITRNLCMQQFRDEKKSGGELSEDWEDYINVNPNMTAENRLVVKECMEQLSDTDREILVLRVLSGFKHREIAQFMDIPLATVLSKYNRAIKKCRKILEKGDEDCGK